jgi:hypothetical protein
MKGKMLKRGVLFKFTMYSHVAYIGDMYQQFGGTGSSIQEMEAAGSSTVLLPKCKATGCHTAEGHTTVNIRSPVQELL